MKLDYARVLKPLQDRDLSLRGFPLHWVCEPVFLVDFHGVLLLVSLVEAEAHGSVGSLSDDATDVVAFKLADRLGSR